MVSQETRENIEEVIKNESVILSRINEHMCEYFDNNSILECMYAEQLLMYLKLKYDNMNKEELLEAATQLEEKVC